VIRLRRCSAPTRLLSTSALPLAVNEVSQTEEFFAAPGATEGVDMVDKQIVVRGEAPDYSGSLGADRH
jgi:hypothetical protein